MAGRFWFLIGSILLATMNRGFASTPPEIGQKIGPIPFETLDGFSRTMENYSKRVGTLIVFISANSPATLASIDKIQHLAESVRLEEILTVGICSQPDESGEELRTFLQNHGCTFPVYRDPTKQAADQLGARFTPEYFLTDKDGILVYHGGLGSADTGVNAACRDLLAGKAIQIPASPIQGEPLESSHPKSEAMDPYGSISFSSELLFSKIPGVAAHHCSTLTEAANGDLLCLWYAGSYESSEDQALYLCRHPKGDCRWSEPQRLISNYEFPPGNAVLFRMPDDRLCILWGRMEAARPIRRGSGWGECRLMQRTSNDHGQTWSEDSIVEGGFGWLPRNAPLTLDDGRFAVPLSGGVGEERGAFLLFLNPDGNGWTPSGIIPGGRQPTAVQNSAGTLLCLLRSHPFVERSESIDGGKTWTPREPTDLKCPDSGIALIRLRSGRLLLVHNDADGEDRSRLVVTQSTDDGKTWGDSRTLESDPGAEYSYPCIIQAEREMIHLCYTYRRYSIKHVTFNENWLDSLDRPN